MFATGFIAIFTYIYNGGGREEDFALLTEDSHELLTESNQVIEIEH